MNESRLANVPLEVGAMSVGSMNGMMSGKNYSHAISCHKIMPGKTASSQIFGN